MAHKTLKSGYAELSERLNRFPQGAPVSELLFKILKVLFNEREAALVSQLPIKPFKAEKAAAVWKLELNAARKILDHLADRGLLVDLEEKGETFYVLPPPMAGFFEFSLMRIRSDIDQKYLSELFYQYLNVEEDFVRELFVQGETQLGRTFVHEPALSTDNALYVLDYERATEVIRTASHMAVGLCYCRHKMEHLGKACKAPLDICMTFNTTAASLIKHNIARSVEAEEGLDLLRQAYEYDLVQFGENVREQVNFICNCCSCCCEAMIAARRFAFLNPVHTTNFLPEIKPEECTLCGKCVNVCPVQALSLVSANDPQDKKKRVVRLQEKLCLGCGLCVRACSDKRIVLKSRPQRVITPRDGTHRAVVMALERGQLQNLIFDNRLLWNHRALAAVLGVILKFPPLKKVLVSRQLKSRYLEALLQRLDV
ncbi:MAG: 4Fe-4S binding protein [Deltaproteobacteria bacterium]|nr:4Fe-4S binding protein [Deltaproteobacteria bacterium]